MKDEELVERLRAEGDSVFPDCTVLRNPDGPEAAALITRLKEDNARLRGLLKPLADADPYTKKGLVAEHVVAARKELHPKPRPNPRCTPGARDFTREAALASSPAKCAEALGWPRCVNCDAPYLEGQRCVVARPEEMGRRAEDALFAVRQARTQLARLIDYAVCYIPDLTDESPLAVSTFSAIRGLDEAFPSTTDQGSGLPLASSPVDSGGEI